MEIFGVLIWEWLFFIFLAVMGVLVVISSAVVATMRDDARHIPASLFLFVMGGIVLYCDCSYLIEVLRGS